MLDPFFTLGFSTELGSGRREVAPGYFKDISFIRLSYSLRSLSP